MEQTHSKGAGLKASVQKLGSHLSSMVMPNIGSFIAWGIFASLFIPTGYLPNEALNTVGAAMQTYLLPLLIAYSGGGLVYGQRGSVVGTIATMGVIAGSDVPMFIGAMIMGPFGGWIIKKFDDLFSDKIPSGFEMLVNNFSSGILGFFLAILGFLAVGPVMSSATHLMSVGVDKIIQLGALPLANLLIEPAKILFLNNAINHGILTPLGNLQVAETGRSILFLLEANPGPGLGVLLAFALFGKGSAKSSSWGAMIIHFIGGIHEIYFPYVMTNPLLFLAVMAGGVTGTFVNSMFQVGLTGPASPGSIIAILGVTARGYHLGVLAGVFSAAIVSFIVASLILKSSKSEEDSFSKQQQAMKQAKAESKGQQLEVSSDDVPNADNIDRIIFACDAGMGSSAMGASLLRKKAKALGLKQPVTNSAINNLKDQGRTLIITQEELTPRARKQAPSATHLSVENFLDGDRYDEILSDMVNEEKTSSQETASESANVTQIDYSRVQNIIFTFDGKVKATTMAASNLRNAFIKVGKQIEIVTLPLDKISDSKDLLIIADRRDGEALNRVVSEAQVLLFDHLLDETQYDGIVKNIQ